MTICVICSDSEGFCNSIIECMAAGLPVVVTNTGGNPELFDHCRTGFLTPTGDPMVLNEAILNCLRQPDIEREMGLTGHRRVVGDLCVERMLEKTKKIYHGLMYKNGCFLGQR